MNNFASGAIGAIIGLGTGYFLGIQKSKKEVQRLKDEMAETEMYFDEQISLLEDKINEISEKCNKKHVEKFEIDGEEVEISDEYDFDESEDLDYDKIAESITGRKGIVVQQSKIHHIDDDEATELINSHKAKLEDVWLFSCGTVTKEDKETPMLDSSRLIGFDLLDELSKADEDQVDVDGNPFFPYFVYNESEQTVFEISKDDRTYREYMSTVS